MAIKGWMGRAAKKGRARDTGTNQTANVSGVDGELAAALGLAPKKKAKLPLKTALICAGGAAVLCGLIFGGVKLLRGDKEETAFREYTVQRGDITVGQSESSSVSLNRETVEFPVSTTVEEIYVKEGSSVKEGDALMKLNVEDIKLNLSSFELEVQLAQLELEKARLEQQSKLIAAEQQLNTTNLSGELASAIKGNTLSDLSLALETAETTLADAKAKYEKYCAINTTFDADYIRLQNLKSAKESLSKQLTEYKNLQTNAKSLDTADTALTKALTTLEVEIEYYCSAHTVDSSGVINVLQDACTLINSGTVDISGSAATAIAKLENQSDAASLLNAWHTYTEALTSYNYAKGNSSGYTYAQLTNLVTTLTTQSNSADSAYTEFETYYKEIYGDISDAEDMADAVADGELAVEKAKLALSEQRITNEQKSLSADQAEETAANAAEVAASTYELTQMELTQAVDTAQEEYDTSLKQLEEVKALIEDDGVVKAPCNGMVATISVEEGDDLNVIIDDDTHTIMMYATLLTMTDISHVYVPITISEEDILSVYIGQPATVSMTAFSGRDFDAEVDAITIESSRSGAATVSYTVNVCFSEENTLDMYEGMSADVTLLQREANDVLYINNQAVTNVAGVATVQKKGADGEGVTTEVVTGFSDGRYVEILSGLAEGDVVLVESAVGQ